jgi:hypothetical protein
MMDDLAPNDGGATMSESTDGLLREGDVIALTDKHKVYGLMPAHFIYSNRAGSFDMKRTEVDLSSPLGAGHRGRYVVLRTAIDGGGRGHGVYDIYPSGHHVWCKSIDHHTPIEVDFYQTGAFTCMIPDIQPIGRADLQWVVKEAETTP